MSFRYMLLKLITATVALAFIIFASNNTAVMANPLMNSTKVSISFADP